MDQLKLRSSSIIQQNIYWVKGVPLLVNGGWKVVSAELKKENSVEKVSY